MLAVAEWPRRQLVKASCFGFDPPAALTGVVIAPPQLFWLEIARGAKLPVGSVSQSAPSHGSRSGSPAKRTSIQYSSTSARCYSKPASVSSEGACFWTICAWVSPPVFDSMVSRW